MTAMERLQALLDRAQRWPKKIQEEAAAVLEAIELRQSHGPELTDEDWRIIDERVNAARRGEIATDQEVATLLDRYRRA